MTKQTASRRPTSKKYATPMFLSTVRTSQQLPSNPLYGNRCWLVLTTIMTKKEHLSLYRETTRKQRQWICYKDDTTKQNSAPWCFCSRRNAWNHSKKTIDRKNITLHFHQESFFRLENTHFLLDIIHRGCEVLILLVKFSFQSLQQDNLSKNDSL